MLRLSGSKLDRAAECAASMVLPVIREEGGAPAVRGIALHAYLETVGKLVADGGALEEAGAAALALVPEEYREEAEAIDLEALPLGGDWENEVSFAWNPDTDQARRVGKEGPDWEHEIPCRLDLFHHDPQESIVSVFDFKFGFRKLPAAEKILQLRFGALASARALGATRARVAIITAPDGRPRFDYAEMDAFDLSLARTDVKEIVARGRREATKDPAFDILSYRRGAWCEYCGSFEYCDAQARVIRALASGQGLAELESSITAPLGSGEAAVAYERWQAFKATAGRIEKAIRGAAEHAPIPLADGMVYGAREVVREKIDPMASETIGRVWGEDWIRIAADLKFTKKSIKRMARELASARKAAGAKATIVGVVDEILTALDADQNIEKRTVRIVDAHHPGQAAGAEEDEG